LDAGLGAGLRAGGGGLAAGLGLLGEGWWVEGWCPGRRVVGWQLGWAPRKAGAGARARVEAGAAARAWAWAARAPRADGGGGELGSGVALVQISPTVSLEVGAAKLTAP
jgi:hypothetical protein